MSHKDGDDRVWSLQHRGMASVRVGSFVHTIHQSSCSHKSLFFLQTVKFLVLHSSSLIVFKIQLWTRRAINCSSVGLQHTNTQWSRLLITRTPWQQWRRGRNGTSLEVELRPSEASSLLQSQWNHTVSQLVLLFLGSVWTPSTQTRLTSLLFLPSKPWCHEVDDHALGHLFTTNCMWKHALMSHVFVFLCLCS